MNEIIELDGHKFSVQIVADCHGVVSGWVRRPKQAHERVLITDGGKSIYYDVQASMEKAIADGWGVRNPAGKTKKQIAAEAVEADFNYIRGWYRDDWNWCGVVVTLLGADEAPTQFQASVWGLASNDYEHLAQYQSSLMAECIARKTARDTTSAEVVAGKAKVLYDLAKQAAMRSVFMSFDVSYDEVVDRLENGKGILPLLNSDALQLPHWLQDECPNDELLDMLTSAYSENVAGFKEVLGICAVRLNGFE